MEIEEVEAKARILNIGARIREIRGRISQEEFARRTGINKSTLGRYERGTNAPDTNAVTAICKAFNVNSEWLLTGKGTVFSESYLNTQETSEKMGLDDEILVYNWRNEEVTYTEWITKLDSIEYNTEMLEGIRQAFFEVIKTNRIEITKRKFDSMSKVIYEEFIELCLNIVKPKNMVRMRGYDKDGNLV
jgi:transcriptional regulator with XRE-family HTH domain